MLMQFGIGTHTVVLWTLSLFVIAASTRADDSVRDGVRLPAGAVMRLGTARLRHPGLRDALESIAFRPDSRSLATRTERLLRVWSVPDGLLLWECTTENKILEVAFSPDNRWIGIAVDATGVQVRSAATGRLHTTVGSGNYRALAFTPDGELLAVGRSRPAAIDVWKMDDGRRAAELECSERTLDQLAFGRDGRSLRVSLSDRGIVRIAQWDVATWQRAHNFDHPELTFQREMSSDGRWFVARQQRRDGVLRRWNLDESRELEAFETTASDFALSGDRWMVTMQSAAGNKTAATIWNVETRQTVKTLDLNLWQGRKARVSPDGATLASVRPGTMVCLWDVGSGRWLGAETGHRLAVQQLEFTRDGRQLISRAGNGLGGDEQSELRVWDLSKGKETNRIDTTSQPFVVLPGDQELATLHFPLGDLASKPGALFRRIEIAAKPAAAPAEKRQDDARKDDARKDDARKLDATAQPDVPAAQATGVAQLADGEWGGYRWLNLAEGGERLVGVAPLQVKPATVSGHRITTWEVKSGRCLTDEVVRERPVLDWVDTSGRVGIGLNREWRPASAQLQKLGFAREYAAQLDQFDLRSGAVSATLKLPDSQRTEFAASRDGRTIAVWLAKQEKGPSSPATDATVQLHSWPDGRLLKKWDRERRAGHDLQRLQLSDDGRWLVAIASGRIDLFDVHSGRLKSGQLKSGEPKNGRRNEGRRSDGDVKFDERDSGDWQYESRCTAVAIHPSDGTLATGHADGSILVWKPGE